MSAVLTAERVRELFVLCHDEAAKPLELMGRQARLDPAKVAEQKTAIAALLTELDDAFRADKGGGWSFLNLCLDRHGRQWGEHPDCWALVVLGSAAGYVRDTMGGLIPADILPGGVPYFTVSLPPEPVAAARIRGDR